MFRKKEQPELAQAYILNGRYVKVEPSKRGGYVEYSRDQSYIQGIQSALPVRGISEIDISESYLTDRDEQEINQKKLDADKLNKSSRRKIPFLQKKKKPQSQSSTTEQRNLGDIVGTDVDGDDDDDDISDITTYDEGIPVVYEGLKKNGLHHLGLNQPVKRRDLDQQYAEEAQIFERMNYIIDNYRQPPAYPGISNIDSSEKSMIQQLLQEKASKQIKDNASMINYCQVDAPKELSMEDLTKILQASHEGALDRPVGSQLSDDITDGSSATSYKVPTTGSVKSAVPEPVTIRKADQLVMRTLRSPRTPEGARTNPGSSGSAGAGSPDPSQVFEFRNARPTAKIVSEIYPRDYDPDYGDSADELERGQESNANKVDEILPGKEAELPPTLNASCRVEEKSTVRQNYVVDVMPSYQGIERQEDMAVKPYVMPPDYDEHPERDYDLGEGDGFDLHAENFNPQIQSESSLMHFREQSETFVPPSPYMYAEIPEWLQVYAKASPKLDEYLKWDMFRLPELDCWQTMLKRLYMKELEQVVFWFEEYRQAMQQEMEKREKEMGILRVKMPVLDSRMKKTDV